MSGDDAADVGLLSPATAGTAAEALTSDRAVLSAMVAFEEALGAPSSGPIDARALALAAVSSGNPTVPLVAMLDAVDTHRGATSQDVVDTALMLVASSVLARVEADLAQLSEVLAAQATRFRETPCVARTLTQQALPTTLGFRVAGWLAGVLDALETVRGCRPLPVSLGGPVGTGVSPARVESVASSLGLSAPTASWHTNRAPVLRLAGALLAVGSACGRLADDVLLMAQTEVGEASDGSAGASSAMAHKTNPTRSVLVVAAARQLPGLAATVTASGVGASERPAGAWHAEWQPLRTMLRLAGAAAERAVALAADLSFDEDALARNLSLLVDTVGEDDAWVASHTAAALPWVDRVLARVPR